MLSEIIVQVAIIDADGIMRATNVGPQPAPPIDLSDREHYRVHRTSQSDTLFISTPLVGRASGRWSVQFTRRLETAQGQFGGVVVASLDPMHLTKFYNSINFDSSTSIALIGMDGIVRSSGGSGTRRELGTKIESERWLAAARGETSGTFEEQDDKGKGRQLVTVHPVHGLPLWLEVRRSLEDDYVEPTDSFLRLGSAALVLSLLTAGAVQRIIRAEALSRRQSQQLRLTLENMSQGIMMLSSSGEIRVINANCCRLLGLPQRCITTPESVVIDDLGDITESIRVLRADVAAHDGSAQGRTSITEKVMPDGTIVEMRASNMTDGSIVCTLTDVTDRRQAEHYVTRLAAEDPLTGLPNRRAFGATIESVLDSCQSTQGAVAALLFLDIDRFKTINDTLGHRIGDRLLIEIAGRLHQVLPAGASLARLGGDEFAVVLPAFRDQAEVEALAEALIQAVGRSLVLDGYHLRPSTSIGIAMAPADAPDVDGLLAAADLALYSVKGDRRGAYRFYNPNMSEGLDERRRLETDLRTAMDEGQLKLFYQPIIDLHSGETVGFEALARWPHPEQGWISPARFIPIAEDSTLIVELGEWALREACAVAARFPAHLRFAVNVSPLQLMSPRFPHLVREILATSGLAPDRLELELTERILIQELDRTRDILSGLKDVGVRIVLDDFGTGYSSLSYLKDLPFDKVKIDRSFVSNLAFGADRLTIIQAVLSITKSLGIASTAEGVETEYQRDLLKSVGCDQAQGWLYAAAMPEEEAWRSLQRRVARVCVDGAV